MRALLDLMRENEAAVQKIAFECEELLGNACAHRKVLHPGAGYADLARAARVEMAKLQAVEGRDAGTRQPASCFPL